jgi:hypothetical protein
MAARGDIIPRPNPSLPCAATADLFRHLESQDRAESVQIDWEEFRETTPFEVIFPIVERRMTDYLTMDERVIHGYPESLDEILIALSEGRHEEAAGLLLSAQRAAYLRERETCGESH